MGSQCLQYTIIPIIDPCTMTVQRYIHDFLQPHVLPLIQRLSGAIFQQDNDRLRTARVAQDRLRTVNHSLACPIIRFVSNPAYLGPFGTVSWTSHEFERIRCKVTENMERNVSIHHTELVCLNARSHRIVHSC
ncbi:transposable element Tcb1 transposase [Trichonephila clavipes]|nr:transposable element Tcb1 transposase [Trichonephila clavipes]